MTYVTKLILIKILHTLIWMFFNFVIFYMLYAAIFDKLDWKLGLGYLLIISEGIVLLMFKNACPLTILASNYSNSSKDNFDIYLRTWLAKYNKLIYIIIVLFVLIIIIFQFLK